MLANRYLQLPEHDDAAIRMGDGCTLDVNANPRLQLVAQCLHR